MKMSLLHAIVLGFSVFHFDLATGSPLLTKRGPTCQNITIPVTISSNNARFPADFSPTSVTLDNLLTNVGSWVFDVLVEGTFNIAASYCEPEVHVPYRANTLQILVHGATYDRNYWSGVSAPDYGYDGDAYSWVAYASQQGYPTLAIDRLGHGVSDYPDPILVVQDPAHVEITNALIQAARAGTAPLPRAFDKIIYVGHSFGSLIGNLFNSKYPTALDATILTGWSNYFLVDVIPVAFTLLLLPASIVDPLRFGDLELCYLEATFEARDVAAFFLEGAYDPKLQALDYARRGLVTCGELVTMFFSLAEAREYAAPVLVVTGDEDDIFCNPLINLLPASCGSGPTSMLAQARALYPAASVYDWYAVPNAGHCWNLHYTAQKGFNASHAWLTGLGF